MPRPRLAKAEFRHEDVHVVIQFDDRPISAAMVGSHIVAGGVASRTPEYRHFMTREKIGGAELVVSSVELKREMVQRGKRRLDHI